MDRNDIIRMAREAGCLLPGKGGDPNGLWEPNGWENITDLMFKFATLVSAHERMECAKFCAELRKMAISEERDECAKIADNNRHNLEMLTSLPLQSGAARCIATAIRAREEK